MVRGALMRQGDGSVIDLLEWRDTRGERPPYDRLNHLGFARIALVTTDIEGDIELLKAAGVDFLSAVPATAAGPTGDSTRIICLEDPDGMILELVQWSSKE